MNKNVKQLWVEALRSNPPQLNGNLGNPQGDRCCLGVLCDIAVAQGVISEPAVVGQCGYLVLNYGNLQGWDTMALPPAVQEWAGLEHQNPLIVDPVDRKDEHNQRLGSLAELNDYGVPMSEIADIIKEQL